MRGLVLLSAVLVLVLVAALPSAASLSPRGPVFGRDGTVRWLAVAPEIRDGSSGERSGAEGPRTGEFEPGIRVDDDLNVEHREPAVLRLPGGRIWALYCERATHWNPELVMVTHSDDNGQTWQWPASRINDTSANAVMFPAIGVTSSGVLVAVWTEMKFSPFNDEIRSSRSTDGGQTWSPTAVIHPINPTVDCCRPALAICGESVLVGYWESVAYPNGCVKAVRSDDAGATWGAPVQVSTELGYYDGAAPVPAWNPATNQAGIVWASSAMHLLFAASPDGGLTWNAPIVVSDATSSSLAYPDLAFANGTFHVVWSDNRVSQYDTNVYYDRTADGVHFGTDVRVNDSYTGNQYEPHIAIDGSGGLHVSWIHNIPFQMDINAFYSKSMDEGANWLPVSPRVNDVPNRVQPYVAWSTEVLADPSGRAYVFWNDGRTSNYYDNIYLARSSDPTGIAEGFARGLRFEVLGNPGPDPSVRLRLDTGVAGAELFVVDPLGRRVGGCVLGALGAGEHRFALRALLDPAARSSGVRFVRISAGRASLVSKVMLR